MSTRIDIFISSTSRDLPDHRREAMDACMRMGMFPIMMEHLPALDADAIQASLEMVGQAEMYLGIFAWRYGYIPQGHDISITEMEYNRAVERGIPRLIFVMHDDHDIKGSDIEKGPGAAKLAAFKERLLTDQVVNFFKSPEDLRSQVIHSLVPYRVADTVNLHSRPASDIPLPPASYVAHPYTLLQTGQVIGRKKELAMLNSWVQGATVCQMVVAIGGMGKSALTWKWFNDLVPPSLTGRLWWSFYESDAHFENFILRSLAYVSQRSREEIEALPQVERESQLLAILDREPFLLVLDGFERMLIAYSRMDAARLDDDDLDQQSDQHNLRKIADPRLGAFLRKLIQVKQSRVLISTRLVPSDLQTATGQPLPGSDVYYLRGLEDEDALRLWAALSVSGSPDTLLPLFHTFENYPLLIRALAGEVARYRRAPGQFDQWRKANPRFDPFELPAVQVKSHVLLFALQGLDESAQRLLQTVAAFRMPAAYDTLAALRLFPTEQELDQVLTDLEDRGLLGWDRRANRYDLHPVVRGVVWDKLNEDHKQAIYERLSTHFEALPQASNVDRLDDLAPTIELYNALIGLKRYDEAFHIFYEHLSRPMQYRWSANRQRVELLEMLFPDGIDQLPHLSKLSSQAHALGHLARSLKLLGYPAAAVPLYERNVTLREHSRKSRVLYCVVFGQLSDVLRLIGRLYDAEVAARRAYINACDIQDRMWQGDSLKWLSAVWATRGLMDQAQDILARAQAIFIDQNHKPLLGSVLVRQAQYALWLGQYDQAAEYAAQAFQIGQQINNEHDIMRATRLRGEAAIGLGDWDGAHQQLHTALRQARATTLVEEELPTLIGLARLSQQRGEPDKAHEYLNDVWAAAEHGPYPLFQVDALNLLAQVESDSGHHDAAVQTADRAYRMAWLEGYSYHWGLAAAKAHLTQLKAAVPDMPPVVEHDPMPEMD